MPQAMQLALHKCALFHGTKCSHNCIKFIYPPSTHRFDKLMRQCWDSVPDKRPTFSQLCASVDAMLTIVAGYMELSEFTETPL